jgi:cell division protein FtsI (penicillin-binding protein 3)
MHAAPATSKTRIIFLGALAFLWLGLLFTRLIEIQVLRHADFARRAQRQQQRTLEITPKRGVIYDRQGRELAVSIGVDSVFAVPQDVNDPLLTAHLLAPALRPFFRMAQAQARCCPG